MPRSAADATRFTPTGPVAYSKASTIDIASAAGPAPPGETPQQKVARLRDAARRLKAGQETGMDRALRRGRRWADGAHRVTVVTLVGLSVVCSGFAAYSLVDMVVYNRRKRAAFLAEQQSNYERALARAYAAEAAGSLTPDLALVLNKERALQQYEAQRAEAKKDGFVARLFGGRGRAQEPPGGAMGFASDEIKRIAEGRPMVEPARGDAPAEVVAGAGGPHAAPARVAAAAVGLGGGAEGGALDRMAQRTSDELVSASRGWVDWLRGRR